MIHVGQDEDEPEVKRDDEEAGQDQHDRAEAKRDQNDREEAGQDARDDEEARQDNHDKHEPEEKGAGDAAGRQDQPREHGGSTATSEPVDSHAEKDAQNDTPDADVRSGGTFGHKRPTSPERPPKRHSATSEAMFLNCCHCHS